MAYIQFTTSDKVEFLHTAHVFGRKNSAANTSLNCHLVSRNHASIEWDGSKWNIQDFSRNGTWLNGKQLNSHTETPLSTGDIVMLGSSDSNGVHFKVCNTDKPQSLVYRPHPSLQIVPIEESNLIPDPMSPDYGLYYCYDRNNWYSEKFNSDSLSIGDIESGPHHYDKEILCAGNRWTLFLLDQDPASPVIAQKERSSIKEFEFQIFFNRGNDDIRINLLSRKKEIKLESKPYSSLIAQLITLQQESEDGWVSFQALQKKTGKSQANINLQLFMLKHHLHLSLDRCKGISRIIERNNTSLRIAISNFSIYRNGKLDQSSDYHL